MQAQDTSTISSYPPLPLPLHVDALSQNSWNVLYQARKRKKAITFVLCCTVDNNPQEVNVEMVSPNWKSHVGDPIALGFHHDAFRPGTGCVVGGIIHNDFSVAIENRTTIHHRTEAKQDGHVNSQDNDKDEFDYMVVRKK